MYRHLGRSASSLLWCAAVLVLVSSFAHVSVLAAQTPEARVENSGSISGRVVDAETLVPLQGARVRLERVVGDGLSAAVRMEADPPSFSTVTDALGSYRFAGLPAASYRLLVERIGYLSRAVQVELRSAQSIPVSVGLEVGPIRLPEVEVVGARPQPYQRTRLPHAEVVGARVSVTRLRQRSYLSLDARELTHGEVVEAVTLGEPDIFRALQRIPGVATRDDYTATIWTRGATWDQTRVYFDGLELYNPTHAGWLFSAVNPDAIGSVIFQPGYRSARWGEGSAAILDLRSRPGSISDDLRGAGEISPASARLTLDGQVGEGQVQWMVAARRTYVDVLTSLLGGVMGDQKILIPYDFSDVIFRVDGNLDDGWGFEVSSILERDRLRGDIPGIVWGNRGRWGNRAGQITLKAPIRDVGLGPLQARLTAGQTLFGTQLMVDSLVVDSRRAVVLPELENHVQHQILGAQVQPAGADSLRWAAGYQLVRDAIRYVGPYSLLGILASVDSQENLPTSYRDELVYSAIWGERRWRLGDRLELEGGVRVEAGDSVFNGGRVRISPRGAARVLMAPSTMVSAGWARTYQYTQDVSPAAGPVGPQLHLSAIWLLSTTSRFRPAARADIATVGVERWFGDEWLATVNGYHRRTTGLLVPNPDTGVVRSGREPDAVAVNSAAGFEVSLRRLMGPWTGSIGYTFGTSRMSSVVERSTGDTVRYNSPAPADIPHALDATAMAHVGRGFRIGGAFTFGSGVPFSRLVLPDTTRPAAEREAPRLELPYAERSPSYASLDLMVEYSTMLGSWQVSAYGQLRNALGQKNAVTYMGSRDCGGTTAVANARFGGVDCVGAGSGVRIKDNFQEGLPRLPLLGVRVAF